jgi:hypothetical protein
MTEEAVIPPKSPRSHRLVLLEAVVIVALLAITTMALLRLLPPREHDEPPPTCIHLQRQLELDISMWTVDHGDTMPRWKSVWHDVKHDVSKGKSPLERLPMLTRCPLAPGLSNGYVYNSTIGGKQLSDSAIVARIGGDYAKLFVTADGQHASPGPTNVAFTPADLDFTRHNGKSGWGPFHVAGSPRLVAAFIDGHVDVLTPAETKGWLP